MRRTVSLAVILSLYALWLTAPLGVRAQNGLPLPGPARSAGLMREQMLNVAFDVQTFLKQHEEKAVAVGTFTGPPQVASGAGAGLVRVLTEELGRLGVRITPSAKFALTGSYRPVVKITSDGTLSGQVRVTLEEVNGKVHTQFEVETNDPGEVAALFGLTFMSRPPAAKLGGGAGGGYRAASVSKYAAYQAALDGLFHPDVFLTGARIKAAEKSPFTMEVLIKGKDGKYRPRRPRDEQGRAYVDIRRGEVYALRLTNRSTHEAAAEVTVDGLNTFTFSENRRSRRWIIKPGRTLTLKGWHRNPQQTNEFLITEYAKGVVALTGADPAGVGTITARFHASWGKGVPPPADEFPKPRRSGGGGGGGKGKGVAKSRKGGGNATGVGQLIKVETASVKRKVGFVRAVVSVRYTK